MAATLQVDRDSRERERRRESAVPLLLSSFPAPPSYIPPTPMSALFTSPLPSPLMHTLPPGSPMNALVSPLNLPMNIPSSSGSRPLQPPGSPLNPPLSRPPLSPLPPLPAAPSPVTETDTLRFISAARSRRASKLSLASTAGSSYSHSHSFDHSLSHSHSYDYSQHGHSQRDSLYSLSHSLSHEYSHSQHGHAHRDSLASNGSASTSTHAGTRTGPLSPVLPHPLRSFPSSASLASTNTSRLAFEIENENTDHYQLMHAPADDFDGAYAKSPMSDYAKSPMSDTLSMCIPRIHESLEDASEGDLTHIAIPDLSPMPSTCASSTVGGFSDTEDERGGHGKGIYGDEGEDVLELGIGASISRRRSQSQSQLPPHTPPARRTHRTRTYGHNRASGSGSSNHANGGCESNRASGSGSNRNSSGSGGSGTVGTNDSISSIELGDLPALREDELDFGAVPPIAVARNSVGSVKSLRKSVDAEARGVNMGGEARAEEVNARGEVRMEFGFPAPPTSQTQTDPRSSLQSNARSSLQSIGHSPSQPQLSRPNPISQSHLPLSHVPSHPQLSHPQLSHLPLSHVPSHPQLSNLPSSHLPSHSNPPLSQAQSHPQLRFPPLRTHPRPPTAVMNKDLPPLPHEQGQEEQDDALVTPTSAESAHTQSTPMRPGAASPDIAAMIAATPKAKSRPNSGSTRRSRSTKRSLPRTHTELAYARSRRRHDDEEEEEDYGEVLDGTGTGMDWRMLDAEIEARLERELEGVGSDQEEGGDGEGCVSDGSEGSDSSIDVRTPLPNLMLRQGMLSPYSKLLPQASRAPSPYDRMSLASNVGSIMTKSGIYKDERDTTRRRVRHRDGRLLRGGLGLTTGLGWSDSEDEDAPSPLTRQISSRVLSRRTSAGSLVSTTARAPHPLARSVSDTLASAADSLARHQARMRPSVSSSTSSGSVPPTAWASSSHAGRQIASTSRTEPINMNFHGHMHTGLDDIHEQDTEAGAMTPSSASSSSLPMPMTPGDDVLEMWPHLHLQHGGSQQQKLMFSTPTPSSRRIPSRAGMGVGMGIKSPMNVKAPAPVSFPHPRERTTSTSSHGSAGASSISRMRPPASMRATAPPAASTSTSAVTVRAPVPRPLRLAQSSILHDRPSAQTQSLSGIRAPTTSRSASTSNVPVPQTRSRTLSGSRSTSRMAPPSSYTPTPTSASASRLARPSPTSSEPAPAIRRPRTGTGMVYRTSSAGASRPSLMRPPSSAVLRPAVGARI